MKCRIDPMAIKSVSDYIKIQLDELKEIKNKLLSDILKISEVYQGKDASLIIQKYQNRVYSLDRILINYENYAIYMQNLAGAYESNLNESKKNLNSILNTMSTSQEVTSQQKLFNLDEISKYKENKDKI